MMPRPFTGTISDNSALVRWAVLRRKCPLPPLVRINLPEPVTLNRLAVARWVLSLYLPFGALRGIFLSFPIFLFFYVTRLNRLDGNRFVGLRRLLSLFRLFCRRFG